MLDGAVTSWRCIVLDYSFVDVLVSWLISSSSFFLEHLKFG